MRTPSLDSSSVIGPCFSDDFNPYSTNNYCVGIKLSDVCKIAMLLTSQKQNQGLGETDFGVKCGVEGSYSKVGEVQRNKQAVRELSMM